MRDAVATIPAIMGVMPAFDDPMEGLDPFDRRIQPLMACWAGRMPGAAGLPARARRAHHGALIRKAA